jgi:reactive intermediate/imine deaminase
MKPMKALLICLFCSLPGLAAAAEVEHYAYPSEPALPLSDAVRVGDLLFLSGKLGIRPGERQLVEGGIQPETRQTLENIKAALEKYGSSMTRVVKCTVFLADIAEWSAMNDVYKSYFPVNPPARSALGVSGLALGARVEIECVAALDE